MSTMARQSQASPFAAVYGIVAANWSLSGADCTDFYSISVHFSACCIEMHRVQRSGMDRVLASISGTKGFKWGHQLQDLRTTGPKPTVQIAHGSSSFLVQIETSDIYAHVALYHRKPSLSNLAFPGFSSPPATGLART